MEVVRKIKIKYKIKKGFLHVLGRRHGARASSPRAGI
jgi:hypothetical protein